MRGTELTAVDLFSPVDSFEIGCKGKRRVRPHGKIRFSSAGFSEASHSKSQHQKGSIPPAFAEITYYPFTRGAASLLPVQVPDLWFPLQMPGKSRRNDSPGRFRSLHPEDRASASAGLLR